jgi:dTDP-4-dehydrorhamnose 3,5-epimerase-like enzyme
MKIIQTEISGLVIIEPKLFSDSRGYFYESFRESFFVEQVCNTVLSRITNPNHHKEYCVLTLSIATSFAIKIGKSH